MMMLRHAAVAFFLIKLASGRTLRRELTPHYDCNAGCSRASVRLTCAEGITFQNDCLPYCQGMDNIFDGPCANGTTLNELLGQRKIVEEGQLVSVVPENILLQYVKEGFVFVGSTDLSGTAPTGRDPLVETSFDSAGTPYEEVSVPPNLVTAIRFTAEGNLYASTYSMTELQNMAEIYANDIDVIDSESVLGKDTRRRVTDTTKRPYRSICEIDYGSGGGGCTGAIIGPNSVLTAAHCVFDGKGFIKVSKLAPGRQRLSNGQIQPQLPGAEFLFRDATIFEEYMKKDDSKFDVAVIRVGTTGLGSIGKVFEPLPIKSLTGACTIDLDSRVTGYPADVENGAMYTSGPCDAWQYSCGAMRVNHQCDTYGGNSGSPIYNSDNFIFGVHTHGGSSYNSGVALVDFHVKNIIEWADIEIIDDAKDQILRDKLQKRRQRRQNRRQRRNDGNNGSGGNNGNTGNRRNGNGSRNGSNRRGNNGNTGNRRNNGGNGGNRKRNNDNNGN